MCETGNMREGKLKNYERLGGMRVDKGNVRDGA
jgi:hypothetical protein